MKRLLIPEMTLRDIMRFCAKIEMGEAEDDCAEWTASKVDGYGGFGIKGVKYWAYRIAYYLANPSWNQEGSICHTCNNKSCVNPRHLYCGDHSTNARDMYNANAGGKQVIKAEQVRSIRERYQNGETAREIAQSLGLNKSTALSAIRNATFTDPTYTYVPQEQKHPHAPFRICHDSKRGTFHLYLWRGQNDSKFHSSYKTREQAIAAGEELTNVG